MAAGGPYLEAIKEAQTASETFKALRIFRRVEMCRVG